MEQTAKVIYGDEVISYAIVERPARRTLGIEVHPDGRVRVLVPRRCDKAFVEEKVQARAQWISRQLTKFSQREPRTSPRQYVHGEAHRYLGVHYRLRIEEHKIISSVTSSIEQVSLMHDELIVAAPTILTSEKIKSLIQHWYMQQAREIFEALLTQAFIAFVAFGHAECIKPKIKIRDMRTRWGSLSPAGHMTLNLLLIQAPPACIEYVIFHELCHLVHRNHGPGFYALLEKVLPDWKNRKHQLEAALV